MDFGNPWQGTKVTTHVRKREATGFSLPWRPLGEEPGLCGKWRQRSGRRSSRFQRSKSE